MARFGFIGPTYLSQSPNADCERCINLYPEIIESPAGKSAMALYHSPGLKKFATLAATIPVTISLHIARVTYSFIFPGPTYRAHVTLLEQAVVPVGTAITIAGNSSATVNGQQVVSASGPGFLEWISAPDAPLAGFNGTVSYASTANIAEASVPQEFEFNGRCFAAGRYLWEVFTDGTVVYRGDLGLPGHQNTSFAANQKKPAQLLVCSTGGNLFILTLDTNTLTAVNMAQFAGPVAKVGFSDTYFVALIANSNEFQLSGLLDGLNWAGLDATLVEVFPDNVVGMLVDHREIFLWGRKSSVTYTDTGNPSFPYGPNLSSFMEQGLIAPESPVRLDNSVFWIGGDERGSGIGWRAQGYTPQRVTNHAVETAWQSYPRIDDAISYAYQDQGHSIWHVFFPTANKAWRYDVSTGMWSEVTYNDGSPAGAAHLSRCHVFAFGKHLVGDRQSGNIYEQSIKYLDDNGTLIIRDRIAPHISNEQTWIFYEYFQLDLETGLGPMPPLLDGQGKPRDPKVSLRWSDDGGHTWSNWYDMAVGKAGQFRTRAIWRRLGRSRDRVFHVRCSDPVPWRFVEAYVKASPGFQPTERLAAQLRKGA